MAYIYRYEIKNKLLREGINLSSHKANIESAVREEFTSSVKSVAVLDKHFEVRLLKIPTHPQIRSMGRRIVNKDATLNSIKKVKSKGSELFIRIPARFFALVEDYDKYETEDYTLFKVHFDMADYQDISLFFKEPSADNINFLKNLDTFLVVGEIKIPKHDTILLESTKKYLDERWNVIDGIINYENTKVKYKTEKIPEIYLDYTSKVINDELNQLISGPFKISNINIIDEDTKSKIKKVLQIKNQNDKIPPFILDFKYYDSLHIEVYNVGQALCSAICDELDRPITYFDFGRAEKADKKTDPNTIVYKFDQSTPVILSHWHTDHWSGVSHCDEALDHMWIVPEQEKGFNASKFHADLVSRGNCFTLRKDRLCNFGTLFLATGPDKHFHNNGIGLLVEIDDKINQERKKRYLLPGDNRYEYIPAQYRTNLDGLVASHHGGRYFDKKKNRMNFIPTCTKNSEIIYSYGEHEDFVDEKNSHSHPSYDHEHRNMGWNIEKHTPSGNCILE